MAVIDFTRSYMTFFGRDEGNIARILLDAACTMIDERTGESRAFYLIAPCRSERMYLDSQLFQMPNYEFCGIFADEECLLVRTHWQSDRDNREYGRNTERFAKVTLDIRSHPETRALTDDRQIYDATLANLPLVAQTELHDEARSLRATIQYPMKTINVLPAGPRFQVDTGPLLLPDFASTATRMIERFDLAHVVYHRFDQAEFILRYRPRSGPMQPSPTTRPSRPSPRATLSSASVSASILLAVRGEWKTVESFAHQPGERERMRRLTVLGGGSCPISVPDQL
ncbi:MAG: hypothetical protein U0232_12795 [Thermomicrobiales bacterium]